jgi:hypothetical protein
MTPPSPGLGRFVGERRAVPCREDEDGQVGSGRHGCSRCKMRCFRSCLADLGRCEVVGSGAFGSGSGRADGVRIFCRLGRRKTMKIRTCRLDGIFGRGGIAARGTGVCAGGSRWRRVACRRCRELSEMGTGNQGGRW